MNNLNEIKKLCKEYSYYDTYCYKLCENVSNECKGNDRIRKWLVILSKLPETKTNETKCAIDKNHTRYKADLLKVIKIIDVDNPKKIVNSIMSVRNKTFEVNETIRIISNQEVEWIGYFLTPEAAYYDRDKPTKYTGFWIDWSDYNGRKRSEIKYKNGKKHGICREWTDDNGGDTYSETIYKNGKLNGKQTSWYPPYSRVCALRRCIMSNDNKQKSQEKYYKNNKLEGISICWYKNGGKSCEKIYKSGRLEGNVKEWYENGQIKKDKNYKNGKLHGTSTEWYENGQIKIKEQYENGKPVGNVFGWYKNGRKAFEGTYEDDCRTGIWTAYYNNGTKRGEYEFNKNNIRLFIEWYPNGNMKSIGNHDIYTGIIRREGKHIVDTKMRPAKLSRITVDMDRIEFVQNCYCVRME